MAFATQHAVHGHAADAGHAALARQQATRGDDLAEPVAGDGVRDDGIVLVPLQFLGDLLLLDEDLPAQRAGALAQRVPAAGHDFGHGLAGLVTQQDVAQRLRHRARGLCRRVGEHVDQFAADQELVLAEQPAREGHRRVADARALHAHVEQVVDSRRGLEIDRRLAHVEIAFERVHGLFVGQRQRTPVVGDRGVEVHEVVGVEDDLLHVHLGPAHAQAMEEAEVGTLHGGPFWRLVSGGRKAGRG